MQCSRCATPICMSCHVQQLCPWCVASDAARRTLEYQDPATKATLTYQLDDNEFAWFEKINNSKY